MAVLPHDCCDAPAALICRALALTDKGRTRRRPEVELIGIPELNAAGESASPARNPVSVPNAPRPGAGRARRAMLASVEEPSDAQ